MSNRSQHDSIIIIGASSAGLHAAHLLARAHLSVHVFERTTQLEPRARTLIVTPEIERVLGHSAASATVNTVHTLELRTGSRSVPITLDEPDLIIERSALIRMLAAKAEAAGAVLHFGASCVDVQLDPDRACVTLRDVKTGECTTVSARAVIAADGVRSSVAGHLGYNAQPTVTVLQARVRARTDAPPGVGKVWFRPHDTNYFYWLCPESADYAAVGLVDSNPRQARGKLDRFLEAEGMLPIEYQSALIPLYRPNRRVYQRVGRTEVMFVGDAAGQVKVTTVGGSVSGLLGAQAAARALIAGTSYARELASAQSELRLHWLVRGLMNRFVEQEYDVLLQLLGGQVGKLLAIHNRDRIAGAFWPILTVQPRLPLLAAQALWRAGLGL